MTTSWLVDALSSTWGDLAGVPVGNDDLEFLIAHLVVFRKRFGRGPRLDDPLFFDPGADEPKHMSVGRFEDVVTEFSRDESAADRDIGVFGTPLGVGPTGVTLRRDVTEREIQDLARQFRDHREPS